MPFAERHTSFNIAEWMVKELDDWHMTPLTEMIVSDTASNQMGVFNEELVPHLPPQFKPANIISGSFFLCSLSQEVISIMPEFPAKKISIFEFYSLILVN